MQHMKSKRVNGTPHGPMDSSVAMKAHASVSDLPRAARSGALDCAVDPGRYRLRQALAKLGQLTRALATSQKESNAARQQVDVLEDTVSRLRQEVIRLEQEVARVRHYAYHDELTGLPNRSLLLDRLNQAIVQAARQQKQVGLLLLDLDGFKSVNDTLGHATGDILLQRVAERLLCCVRGADTVCRYGGDEFVILLPEIDGEKIAAEVAQKLRAHLGKPYVVGDHSIAVTASIGVAVYPCDGSNQMDLIRRADIAMYLAKAHNNSSIRSLQPAAN